MIDVYVKAQAKRDIRGIRDWLWEEMPWGTREEYNHTKKIVDAEMRKIERAIDRISRYPSREKRSSLVRRERS